MYVTRHRAEVVDFTDPFMNIHATILIKRPRTGKPTPIHTVEQLVDQHTIRYGTLRTGIIVRSFRTSNTSISRLTWEKIKAFRPTTFTQTNEEGIHKVRTSNGRYAFILPDTIGSYIAHKSPCDVITVDEFLMDQAFALASKKGSGLVNQLNWTVTFLRTSGFLKKLKDKWWVKENDCNGIQSSKVYSLSSGRNGTSTGLNWIKCYTTFNHIHILYTLVGNLCGSYGDSLAIKVFYVSLISVTHTTP